jgi:V-type H+-transporting ATPase subunit a
MQFEDMNARDMHRPYKRYIQRIDECERIIRFLVDDIERNPKAPPMVKGQLEGFLQHSNDYKLEDVEARLKRFYIDFEQFKENNGNLLSKRNAAREERYVVQAASIQLGHRDATGRTNAFRDAGDFDVAATQSLLHDDDSGRRFGEAKFNNVAGVIPLEDQVRFERALFRATRGNTYTHFQQFPDEMLDPKTGKAVRKSVFVIYFQDSRAGQSLSAMGERVNKICSSFGVNTYPWPSSVEEAEARENSLMAQEKDANALKDAHDAVMLEASMHLIDVPRDGAGSPVVDRNSLIEDWRLFCVKERAIYATLNMFEGHMNLRANCWYPVAERDQIRALLIQHSSSSRQQGSSSAMLMAIVSHLDRHRRLTFGRTSSRIRHSTSSTSTACLVTRRPTPCCSAWSPSHFSSASCMGTSVTAYCSF